MGWTFQGTLGSASSGGGGASDGGDVDMGSLERIGATTFYGFCLDPATGRLTVQEKTGDEPVRLPQEGVIDPLDPVNWVFTTKTLTFAWPLTQSSHLIMGVSR